MDTQDLIKIDIDDNLYLLQISSGHAPALYDIIDNERSYLRRFLIFVDKTTGVDGVKRYIDECDHNFNHQRGVVFVIIKDEEIVGSIGIHNWHHDLKQAEIGYWISESHSCQGIVTKAVHTIMAYGFDFLKLEKMEIRFVPHNDGSRRIAEKAHCTIEGILRKSYLLNGRLEDLVVAGILRDEWVKSKE